MDKTTTPTNTSRRPSKNKGRCRRFCKLIIKTIVFVTCKYPLRLVKHGALNILDWIQSLGRSIWRCVQITDMWILPRPRLRSWWEDPTGHITMLMVFVLQALKVFGYGVGCTVGKDCVIHMFTLLLVIMAIQLVARVATDRLRTGRTRWFGTAWEENRALSRRLVEKTKDVDIEALVEEADTKEGDTKEADTEEAEGNVLEQTEADVPPEKEDGYESTKVDTDIEGELKADAPPEEEVGYQFTKVDSDLEDELRRKKKPWRTILLEAQRKKDKSTRKLGPTDAPKQPRGAVMGDVDNRANTQRALEAALKRKFGKSSQPISKATIEKAVKKTFGELQLSEEKTAIEKALKKTFGTEGKSESETIVVTEHEDEENTEPTEAEEEAEEE
ncbi:hypothetical protein BZA05DRAFT_421286 [Tricharina praecox]|uniref:uncharacterized protein n=1 Tax=Tricharina praecox TaxID=43433 RepID=UPI00221EBC3F|nr:uncharacterized protein BZA05DRAFT_421286 [Tricharina praecox]KAI5845463.1 hypothetical protein BZA05DRAFT_421286 [Tricharina praecox]